MAKCPYCGKELGKKAVAVEHINRYHGARLEADRMDAAQSLYYSTHGTLSSTCMCGCGRPTEWNYHTGKPHKVSSDPRCRERLRSKAKENMIRVYGKTTLLDDMEHQKEMQAHRPTAGKYTFSDGGQVGYLSKPEAAFLKFNDVIMEMTSNMIQDSPEYFDYYDPKADVTRKYIPDYYLPDYNLLVEIKDGGKHTNTNPAFIKETKYKVALKDEVMRKQNKYNFIKIVDNNFGPYVELLYQIVHQQGDSDTYKKPKKAMVVITENACMDLDEKIDLVSVDETFKNMLLVLVHIPGTNQVMGAGVAESELFARIYMTDYTADQASVMDRDDPFFTENSVTVYKCIADESKINEAMQHIIMTIERKPNSGLDIMDTLASFGIFYADANGFTNNDSQMCSFIPAVLGGR